MFTDVLCSAIEIVSEPSVGRNIAGLYSYIEQSDERPMYQKDNSADLCLFHFTNWKVELCELKTSSTSVGFILSKGSSQPYPQDVGQAWRYYDSQDTVDDEIEVKCTV